MGTNTEFWKNIKSVRKEKKIKQSDMATLLGISQPAYSDLESEKTELKIHTILMITEYLGIDNPFLATGNKTDALLANHTLPELIAKSPTLKRYFELQAKQLEQSIDIQKEQLEILRKLAGGDQKP